MSYILQLGDDHQAEGSTRVAPVLKEQIDSGKINLTAIINTHQ